MKRQLLALFLVLGLLLVGCSATEQISNEFELGQTVATHWFEFRVESVRTAESYNGCLATEGSQLVICTLTLENTFDEEVPMIREDFLLLWESKNSASSHAVEGTYAMEHYSASQFYDEYTLEADQILDGTLVFLVPQEVERAAVQFTEYFADSVNGSSYNQGRSYQVWFDL